MMHSSRLVRPIQFTRPLLAVLLGFALVAQAGAEQAGAEQNGAEQNGSGESTAEVSYHRDIVPIFRGRCYGCHQPAKRQGDYLMTSHADLLRGGESGESAIIPGDLAGSYLLELITPHEGEASMPASGKPLSDAQINQVRQWISAGAVDDSPPASGPVVDASHPPIYTKLPLVTSLDVSPNGDLVAVAGYHEVVLHTWQSPSKDATASEEGAVPKLSLSGRLIGMSPRIEKVRFSPDGSQLAVAAGTPGEQGELQVWDVGSRELVFSKLVTFDTLRGASWSPDGKLVAVGGADTIVRAFDVESGEQVFYQGAHDDWSLDTVFSVDGSFLVSVGRDMAAKLMEVATERFVDNITSITPGALKGGIQSVTRHPDRDEVFFGGADGVPKIYRMERTTKRVIGDDANQLWAFPPLPGRIFSVDISRDGTRLVAASSLDGTGTIRTYAMERAPEIPKPIQDILHRPVFQRSAEERKKLQTHFDGGIEQLATMTIPESAQYAVAFSTNGDQIVAAGTDGMLRIYQTESGTLLAEHPAVPQETHDSSATAAAGNAALRFRWGTGEAAGQGGSAAASPSIPEGISELTVVPQSIELTSPIRYAQLVVSAHLQDGSTVDVTRLATYSVNSSSVDSSTATVDSHGLVTPSGNGEAVLSIRLGDHLADVPITCHDVDRMALADYVQDVAPVLSRAGCNMGTCHGAQAGKAGFKLSLRGYDPLFDVRALTDELAGRRVNLTVATESMMLQKPSGDLAHEGGVILDRESPHYQIVKQWIDSGAELNLKSPRVVGVSVVPSDPVVETIGSRQQVRVVAEFADGTRRDVTREAFIESGNTDVVAVTGDQPGLVETLRRGEAPLLIRYEGRYASTTVTVMGDREGFEWSDLPANNLIDELVAQKWKRTKTTPSPLSDDYTFLRRVYLDLTGLPPTPEQLTSFLADERPEQERRENVIETLIGSPAFVDYWTNKWADLLQVNRKYLGADQASKFRAWIRKEVESNTPYDQFAAKILTAGGSTRENPPAAYFKIHRTPEDTMENTTHLFLATRFNCNKCHDHPFERWTQDQYYELAAYFAQVELSKDPAGGDQMIGRTAVEAGAPLYEVVADGNSGEMKHERTGAETPPSFPYDCDFDVVEDATRRQELASWITSPDNPYFAKSFVNRIWGYLFGTGIIEPIDDIRAGNPPSNPALLDYLTKEFISHDFDVRHVMRIICQSRTYQLSVETNRWNEDDQINFSHAQARRLPAEVLYDAIHQTTGTVSALPGVPPGTRAAALPDSGVTLPDGFLGNLGRPSRESACECERSNQLQLGPVMALVSGPTVGKAISNPSNAIATLVNQHPSNRDLAEALFLRVLARPATDAELAGVEEMLQEIDTMHEALVADFDAAAARIAPAVARAEIARQSNVVALETKLQAYREALQPVVAQKEAKRMKRIGAAKKELADRDMELAEQLTTWTPPSPLTWQVVSPDAISATYRAKQKEAKFQVDEDGTIVVSEARGKGAYIIDLTLPQGRVTGLRLEALAHESLPAKGPGLSPNGNFVLNEIEARRISIAGKTADESSEPEASREEYAFAKAQATFSQSGYEIAKTIDGVKQESNDGWAIAPQMGKSQTALFQFREPVVSNDDHSLQLELTQIYTNQDHWIGRLRISVTDYEGELNFGLPPAVEAAARVAADERTEDHRKVLLGYLREKDKEYQRLQTVLSKVSKPLAKDRHLGELEEQLKAAQMPLSVDPELAKLQRAVTLSQSQLENRRLTVAQDLVWALLNSPEFLYNH